MTDYEKIVDYTAALAMVQIPEAEKKVFSGQIGKILQFIEKLNELDTSQVSPTAHILSVQNVTRPDVLIPCGDRSEYLKIAPEHDGTCFKVPQVIQES